MEHKIKRVFAFLLSMLMLVNSVPLNAFATDDGHDHEPEGQAIEGSEHTHSLVSVEAKDASCTEDGNIAYFYCECGKYFYDQDGTSEIPAESVVIAGGHSWGEGVVTTPATEDAEGVMTYTCGICGEPRTETIEKLQHTHAWGEGVVTTEATETAEGVMTYTCSTCGEPRTEPIPVLAHTHSLTKAEDGEYWICSCGSKFADEAGTTPYVEEPVQIVDECAHTLTSYEAKAASCTEDGNSAYWSCADCGKFFSDEGVTEIEENSWVVTANHTMKHMEEVDASCTVPGTAEYWFCTACGGFFADEAGNEAMDYVPHEKHAFSGHTWDFTTNSSTSNKGVTLTKWNTSNRAYESSPVVITGNALSSDKVIYKMSETVTLNSAEDWTLEIVAKGNGTSAIGAIFGVGRTLTGPFVYINAGGDLMIGKSGGLVDNDGTTHNLDSNNYTYYKVADEDYKRSALNGDSFDVTQYHTYQLRCTDGVFSFWLDGEKIGNLAMSEQTTGRPADNVERTAGTGTSFDFSKMAMTNVGIGNSKGSTATYGLIADVKYLGIYPGHSYSGDCDASCNNEGCTETRNVSAEHTWDDGVVTEEATAEKEGVLTYTCSVCGATETEVIPVQTCSHEMTHVEAQAATCTTAGNSEYWSCAKCGKYFADVAGVEEVVENSWVLNATGHGTMTKTEAKDATCTKAGNPEYYTCATCGKHYAEEAGVTELTDIVLEAKGHGTYTSTSVDASCVATGGTLKQCPECGSSYYENIVPGLSGYIWDFSKGSISSTNGGRTLSLVKTGVSGAAEAAALLKDGVMAASGQTTMKFDQSITLNSSEDWTVELVAKGYGTTTMRSFLSTSVKISGAVYVYITGGDLSLVKSAGFTADNGSTISKTYTYYKVSDADYAKSPMGQGTFDQTQYHTYQLRCVDGVFSYWLDGEKIGDLALSEQSGGRNSGKPQYTKGNGCAFASSLNTLTFTHMGCGSNDVANSQGLTADVKSLAIYTGHVYSGDCDETCNNTGCTETRTVSTEHTWDEGVITEEATSEKEGTLTYTCSVCGATKTEIIPIKTCEHEMAHHEAVAPDCTNAGNSEYWSCGKCGKFYADEFGAEEIEADSWVLNATGHGTMTQTPAKAATCTKAGNPEYYTCATCGKHYAEEAGVTELTDIVLEAKGHGTYTSTSVDASCVATGGTLKQCPNCGSSYYENVVPGLSGHVWDFTTGNAVSNNGNTLTAWSTSKLAYASEPISISGDVLSANKTIYKMSKGVALKSSEDWMMEIVAKGNSAQMGAVFSNSRKLTGTAFVYINVAGDLMLGKQLTSFVTDSGATVSKSSSAYAYYKVSNADFEKSILNTDAFDLNEYHTYQLRCENGVFSYWLDGQKIGDLALTEYATGRSADDPANEFTGQGTYHKGTPCNFTSMTMDHVGNGNKDGNNATYGLIADVKSLAIYSGHAWTNACDTTCDNAGCTATREVTHSLTEVPAKEANCTTDGNIAYWSCSVCGSYFSDAEGKTEITDKTSVVIPAAHTYSSECDEVCNIEGCGAEREAADHNYNAVVTEPTFEADGYTTYTCPDCGDVDVITDEGSKLIAVAKIGEQRYTTLAEAVSDAAAGETIILLADVTIAKDSYIAAIGKTVDFNGHTVHGTLLGTMALNGGLLITAEDKRMIGHDADMYMTEDAVFSMTDVTGSITLISGTTTLDPESKEGWTLPGQILTIGKDATFIIAEGVTMQVRSTVIVEGTVQMNGTANLYEADATITAEEGMKNITTTAGDEVIYVDGQYTVHKHTLKETAAKEATCTEAGNSAYWTCTAEVCGKFFSDEGKTVINENAWVIPAHGLTHVEAVPATCQKAGNVEYWHCDVCDQNYADADANTKLNSIVDAQLEHVYSEPEFTWAENNTCKAAYTCSVGNESHNVDCVVTPETLDATCTQAGDTVYTATIEVGGKTYTDEKTVQGATLSPVFGAVDFVWATNESASASITCILCNGAAEGHKLEGDAVVTVAESSDGDCQTDSYVIYKAAITLGGTEYTDTKRVNGDKGSHKLTETTAADASCTADGNTAYWTCSVCGKFFSDAEGKTGIEKDSWIVKGGHKLTHVEAKEANGTEAGNKEYWFCSACDKFFSDAEGKTEIEDKTSVVIPAFTQITMKYDDRLAIADLNQSGEPVITTKTVTSNKVGTSTKDNAVVTYVDGKLIAVGVGTAEVIWDTGAYLITVEPATISILMVTGHSLGSGSEGDKNQSIITEEGQVYSTSEMAYSFKLCTGDKDAQTVEGKDVTGMGLGYGSELRPTRINLLNESSAGVQGMDSALAYRWVQLTGEKVWILNTAKGSTSLSTWQEGGYNYRHAVELFTTAQEIMYNEVQAGHYILNKMGIVNYTTANGDQTWKPQQYTDAFNSMWNGFQREMAVYDFDGDGKKDTVDCIGLLTFWGVCPMNKWDQMHPEPLAFYTSAGLPYYGKLINYSMSAYGDNGVIMASNVGRSWTSDADVAAYFAANPIEGLYGKLQNGTTHTSPSTLQNGVYGDGVHYNQLGYNVQGIETAESMYEYWYGKNDVTSVKLLQANGVDEVPAAIEIPVEGTYVVVPDADPTSAKLSYTLTGDAASYDNCIITGEKLGTATLTIQDQDGKTLKTVDITVREKTDEDLADTVWYEWDFSKGSATNTAGVTTDNTLTLVKSADSTVTSVEDMLKDGVLNASKNTTMKLSKSVILDPAKNWAIEITAKGDGINAIRSFASTDVTLGGYYVYISPNGDLSIVHKGAFTADDGTAVASNYTYYKVSNADFEASVLNTDAFDITQYHTYQLRCENGIFAFWLDGEKIGDLALSEQSGGRGDAAKEYTQGNGTPFGVNTMTITHVGCGSTKNASSQGLMATVKSLKFFSDSGKLNLMVNLDAVLPIDPMMVLPGEQVTLPQPDVGDYCAKFVGWSTEQDITVEYKAGDTYTVTGFAPASLYAVWEAFETSDGEHVFVDGVCTNCGSKKPHKMTATEAKDATCYADGNSAYWTCSECGKYFSDAEGSNEIQKDSWIIAGGHQMTEYKATDASCDGDGNTAYWSCSRCEKYYSDAEGQNTIEKDSWIIPGGHQLTHVEAKAATCVMAGNVEHWHCDLCKKNYSDEAATKELTSVEIAVLADYVWDFSQGTPTSTNGGRTFSYVTTHNDKTALTNNGTMEFADGAMHLASKTALQLNEGIRLNAENDWAFEATLRTTTDKGMNLLASGKGIAGSAKSIHMTTDGRLGLMAQVTVNGVKDYSYYVVSDEDYAANMPADFSMADYHTYRLECNDGIFSFHLDGKKIGDLSVTKSVNSKFAPAEGAVADFSDFTVKYMSSGINGNVLFYGVSGDIKNMGVYPAHIFDNTCDTTCNNEGCTFTRVTSHAWGIGEIVKYPTETEEGERKFTCTVCGETKTEKIPVSEHIHVMTETAAVEAGCETEGNSAYWYCSGCQKYFSDEAGKTEIEKDSWIIGVKGHSWDKGTVTTEPSATAEGVKTYSCSGCTETKTEVVPATDYAWDFEKGEAISTFGTNTITVVENAKNGTMSVADGVMTANTVTMELAHSVKLTAANKWAFEITMKAHTNDSGAIVTPKTVLAENSQYSSGNSIYINNVGGMTLLKKATIEGVNDYWYYRVPMETFQANMPADFDMTKYHTYRLECDGEKYSFWLDGEKIGELGEYISLNKKDSNGNLWVHQGEYLNFSSITAKYIGNGSSSKIAQFGFTGDVEQMCIITGDAAITHEHTMTATEAKDVICTADGNSAYWYCSSCDKYFSDAKGKNEIEKDSWIIKSEGHNLTKTDAVKVGCETDGRNAYWTCSVCAKYFSDAEGKTEIQKDSWIIPALTHSWDDGAVTTEPTETTTGIRTYTCGNCGNTRTEIIPVLGHVHNLVKTDAVDADCTKPGNTAYWTCSGCGLYFSDADGNNSIVKDSWIIAAKGHTMTATAAQEATCTTAGNSAYWTCSVCGKYYSDAEGKTQIEKDSWILAAGHKLTETAAKEVTCEADGNSAYWTCGLCGKYYSDAEGKTEIEKDSWIIPGGHQLTHVEAKAATCGLAGNVEHWNCSVCKKNYSSEAATKELTSVEIAVLADYVWDFSQGTPTSTNGGRTFSYVTTHNNKTALTNNGTMEFADGAMHLASKTALQLNEGIRLNADKDWAFEVTLRTTTDKGMNLLASGKGIAGSAKSIHMTTAGSLGLMAQVTVNGVEDYSYYVVSDEDFEANVPADFSMADYHTYRLECNDGIFSFHLDGKKIGDLSVTKSVNSKFAPAEGAVADFSDFTVKYMSSGTNGNILFYGVSGDIKSMGVYPAHIFDNTCDTTCNNEGCTFTRVTSHAWGIGEIVKYPTDTTAGERKFTCSGCGETKTEVIPVGEHIHKLEKVEATETSCAAAGNVEHWHCNLCGKNYADEHAVKELENVAIPQLMDTIWDFSTGTAVSGSGNQLTLVKSADATVTDVNALLKDGTLAALSNTTMKMSETVTLKSSQDWTIELVAKGVAGSAIRSFMSTSSALSGVYLYINDKGDLSIVKKGAFTADDGTAVSSNYTYYKVSDEDYNMSILASEKFDITEYHTYQLRCEDGVFSFWLDNEKIGDLALSEQTGGRSTTAKKYTAGTGTPFDFSTLKMAYIGCGSSTNAASQGLKAVVKSLSIYPYHSYTDSCDTTCDNDGCTHTRQTNHTWDKGEIIKAPTETTEGIRKYTCTVCGETKTEVIPELGKIVMEYDDRLNILDLGQKGAPTEITSNVLSKKVGTDTPDDAVIAYVDGKLIAVGVGTAMVTWGSGSQAVSYNITVEPATISMLMVTGHSLGSGSQGTTSKSIICEDGEIYCTNERAYAWKITTGSQANQTVQGIDVTGMGLGYGSELRPKAIDALNESGSGTNGVDSGIAYNWAKLTGEKVWVLNSAKGSTHLGTWVQGGFNYRHAVELFTTAQEIMYNEVQAGHYKLNKMGIVNFTTANGDQTWAPDKYTDSFNSMWEGFQKEMAVYDFDGDGTTDTVDCISLLPLWNVCAMNKWDNLTAEPLAFFNSAGTRYYGKLINYHMSAYEDNGVILGSSIMRQWTKDADVAAFFKANPIENMYGKLQDGTTDKNPTTVRDGVYGDGVHYGQLGYNVLGIDIAKNMYDYWYGQNALTSLRLLQADGVTEVPAQIEVRVGEEYVVAPDATPASAKLNFSISNQSAAYTNCMVVGVEVGEAVLTIQDQDGKDLKSVKITVLPAEEVEEEEIVWYTWDFAKESATNTSGSSLDNTLALVQSEDASVTAVTDLLKDGTLAATSSVTMNLSKPVTLKSSRNWAVELVAKSDDGSSIRSFLSTDVTVDGTYFHIDGNGDLSIVKKGSFKSDDGATITSGYTYYKVSDADYNESILGSGNFDITEYHSYQLRCTNGIFSYWLDGEKIGDLALSEQTTQRGDSAREYTKNNGTPFDFSELVMTHIGCGTESNAAAQGMTAIVKELKIYTNSGRLNLEVGLDALAKIAPMHAFPGETIVLPSPNNGEYCAKFLGWAEKQDGTGKRYQAGDTYDVIGFEPTSLYGVWQAYETSDGVHTFVDGVCTSCGTADGDYNSWDIWDFEDNSAISDDGVTTISRITTNHSGSAVTNNGTMSVSGGVMHANTVALEMSDSIKLTADKGWSVEFTMKALADSNGDAITPKTLLAEEKLFSEGTSIYLTATGDMLLAQKGNIGGTNTYWYFKVSDEDFAANMPARFDITKYHTYRITCDNGVFSYWLDGEKIGDFALTSDNMGRSGTVHAGQKLDYSEIDVQYIGNGNTGNCKAFGFTGDVDRIAIYTENGTLTFVTQNDKAAAIPVKQIYPAEKVVLPTPDTGDYCVKFTGWTRNQDGSGTVYPAGSVYEVQGVESFTLYGNWEERSGTSAHTYGRGVITAPTCASEGYTTYTCTFCGHKKITDLVTTAAHSFTAEVAAKEYLCASANYDRAATYYRSCIVCGLSSGGTGGESTFTSGNPGDGYYSVVSKQDWDTAPGITESEIILNNSTGERRQAVHVMQVDINDPYASILPSYMGMNPTPGNYRLGTMTQQAQWVEKNMGLNVVGGMNTCLSWYTDMEYLLNPSRIGEPLGILVIDGTVYSNNTIAKTCLVVNYDEKDGVERPADIPKVELRYTSEGVTGWEEQVISCNFDFVVKDGKNTSKASHANQSAKSVLGFKADGTIVIMQNDGEQAPYSNGMSVYEIGEAMITLGCIYAVRCDGGGTSTYISQRPGEELKLTSSPADGAQRPTTGGILVISSAPATGEFMRATITAENTHYAPGSTVTFDAVGTDLVGTKVEIPDDAVWQIKEDGMGTIEKGVFVSNGKTGTVTAQIVYNGKIAGQHTIEIVKPETFQFRQSVITVPYGKTVELILTATTNGGLNEVAVNYDDIVFTTDNEAIGTFDGKNFTAVAEKDAPEKQTSNITATMKSTGMTAKAQLNLGKASIVLDDFENGIDDWRMRPVTSRPVCDYTFVESNASNGYVHSGSKAVGMIMDNHTQMQEAGYYAQFVMERKEPAILENANSVGAWIYVPDDFYNLWVRLSYYTKDESGAYTKRNTVNAVEGGEVYTTIEESGWHYFSCDISGYESVQIKNAFIEILSQHCSANALYQTVGSPHGMSAIYVDDVTIDYSEAADDREEPIFGDVTLVAGGEETALYKRELATTSNSIVTVRAAVAENQEKTNASGLNGASAKAYVDGVSVGVEYADGVMTVRNVALADGAHRVKFEISDNAGNTAVVIRVINVASGVAASAIEVVPADPTLDRLYGGSVYWMDVNATRIETVQKVSFDIDLNAVNHWELDHMELAEGFSAAYTVDSKTNTATVTINRTGDSTLSGKQKLASLPIRVIYFDTDIALSGYTAKTFWTDYNFWPQDVAVDVDRGVIEYVDGYENNVRGTFSSREYSIDTEMYINGLNMDPDFRAQRGTAHVHTAKAMKDTEATCTEPGITGRTYCDVCESVVVWGSTQAAAGHEYVQKDGIMACAVCGEKLNGVLDGKTYIDGVLVNGWVDDTYYYEDGVKVTGNKVIDGHMCTFDKDGVYDPSFKFTGFYETEDGKMMYFVNNEYMTGYQYLEGQGYYFDDDGYGFEGEYDICGETCLFEKGKYVSCSTADVYCAGMAGPDAYFVLYKDGTFKLTGTGDTYDYSNPGTRPYAEYLWRIEKLDVAAGITGIGHGLMMNTNVSDVVFAENSELTTIGREAFKQCYKLEEMELPAKVTTIKNEAFGSCTNLEKLVMPVSITEIRPDTFKKWENLTLYVVDGSYSMKYAIDNQIPYVTYTPDPATMNGIIWLNGELYYYRNGEPYYAGLIEIDGDYYYINSSCKVVTGRYYVNKNNGLMDSGYYDFAEDGKMIPPKTGIFEEDGVMYYYKNGKKFYAGLIEIDGAYYYVNSSCKVVTGRYYVTKNNGLMPSDHYFFEADGKMNTKNGIVAEDGALYYYKNGERTYAGLIEIDGYYYYVNSSCKVVTGKYYVNRNNGLMESDVFFFDENGRMDQRTGIYEDADGVRRYYRNGILTYAGLIEIDGYYYYINSSCKVVTGKYTINMTNDLMPRDYYFFDDLGRMIMKNGIIEENGERYYYRNGGLYYAGLIEIDGSYYYINGSCKVVTGRYTIWKTNDLMPEGEYFFDEDGKMIMNPKDGIVKESDGLYYYRNGVKEYAGLIEIDGHYYYANSKGMIVTGQYTVWKTNGLMEEGSVCTFDANGRMIMN